MFKLEVSEQMMMTIINALGNHAYREAAPVIMELQRQIGSQRMPQQAATNGNADRPAVD